MSRPSGAPPAIPRREWLRHCARDLNRHWQQGYAQDVAAPVSRLAVEARALGAEVVTDACLPDLGRATQRSDAVVLLAHWKGPDVLAEDLLEPDAAAIAGRLSSHPDMAELAAAVRRSRSHDEMAACLQGHVCSGTAARLAGGEFTVRAHPGTVAALRRDALDRVLAGLLRPGNRIELSDGLFDASAVESCIAPDYAGVLDLTSCQARTLADHVDRSRMGACGVVQFEGDVEPEPAALAIGRTLQHCAEGEHDYLVARQRALDELSEALRQETEAGAWPRALAWLRRTGLGRRR